MSKMIVGAGAFKVVSNDRFERLFNSAAATLGEYPGVLSNKIIFGQIKQSVIAKYAFPDTGSDQIDFECLRDAIEGHIINFKDSEVLGLDQVGSVIQWNAHELAAYISGEKLEEFGIDNLTEVERIRVGLQPSVGDTNPAGVTILTSCEFGEVFSANIRHKSGNLGCMTKRNRLEIRKIDKSFQVFLIERRYDNLKEEEPKDVRLQQEGTFENIGKAAEFVGQYISDYQGAVIDDHSDAVEVEASSNKMRT